MNGVGNSITKAALYKGGGGPVYLPSTTISDVVVKGNASGYVDIGNMSLPAGDWCIFFAAVRAPTTANTDYFLLSLGAQSDTILSDNGSLTIGWPGAAASPASSYGYAAVGKDDAGTALSPRSRTFFASSAQGGVSGPMQNAGANDGGTKNLFIQKSGTEISFWVAEPNVCAIKTDGFQTTAFGAISAKAARLGCLGKAALSGFSTIGYQRFGRIAKALTQYQMEAIASGVDPRVVANFSAADGDLLWAFSATPTEGATFNDLIQEQVATAHGTFSAQSSYLPATVDQNQIRLDIDRYRVFQNNGATTDLPLSGTVYGANGDIQIKLVNHNNTTEQVAYTTIATSAGGRFSGTLSGVTTRLLDYRAQARKLVDGSQVGSNYLADRKFATGPVVMWLGQSLAQEQRSNNSYSISGGTLANNGRFQASAYALGVRDNYALGVSQQTGPGYGEGRLCRLLGDALGFCNMQINDAVSGSSIEQWLADTVGFNSTSPTGMLTIALTNLRRYRPKFVIWHQGENNLGNSYADYQTKLEQLYGVLSAAITWDWKFLVIPLDNNFYKLPNPSKDIQMQRIRAAQIDWANAKIAGGDTKVVFAATANDILRLDTNAGDGIHKIAQAGGYGAYAERMSQTILQLEGNQTYTGLGPKITSAHWNGDATVDVTVTHNGGTGLQTIAGGAPTGFAATLSPDEPTTGPVFPSPLTISSVAITDATTIRITLSATPASAPYIWYQWGCPGLGDTDASAGLTNAVSDNGVSSINTARGFPLQPLTAAMSSA